jgi:hypothetical protein
MAFNELVTPKGDITLLDRTGGRIHLEMEHEEDIPADLSGLAIWFEIGSVSVPMTTEGVGKYVDITPEMIDTIIDEGSSRFAVINKTADPDEVYWEGYLFIRTVD